MILDVIFTPYGVWYELVVLLRGVGGEPSGVPYRQTVVYSHRDLNLTKDV